MARKSNSEKAKAVIEMETQPVSPAVLIPITVSELASRMIGEDPQSVRITEEGDWWITMQGGVVRVMLLAAHVAEFKAEHYLA